MRNYRNSTYYLLTPLTAPISSALVHFGEISMLFVTLTDDNMPAIIQGKCKVQRMSQLFAKHWALT